jgi:hypothetical protein
MAVSAATAGSFPNLDVRKAPLYGWWSFVGRTSTPAKSKKGRPKATLFPLSL